MAGPTPPRSIGGPTVRLAGIAVAIAGAGILALAGSSMLLGTGPGPSANPDGSTTAAESANPSAVPVPGHEVYGFIPYWEMDGTIVAHLATIDVSTVALFSVTHSGKGTIVMTQNGAKKITGPIGKAIIADAHERHRRVDLVYTSFGTTKNAKLFGSTDIQDRVIAGLVTLAADLKVDGIAVDVEQIDDEDIPAYGAFIGRLRTALRADHPDATVTVATGAGRQGSTLAKAASDNGADRVFLMGYDYRIGASQPGATAPMGRRDGDERTLSWSLDLYLGAGVPPEKTLLGLPLYGVAWPAASGDLGAPSTGKGVVWVPRQHLDTLRNKALVPVYDQLESVAFLSVPVGDAWTAIYFDTPQSLTPKLALADQRGLAGAGLWAVGYERGLTGYDELFGAFRAGRLPAVGASTAQP